MSKLGDKIKEIRINEGLSQEAFAKELGYTSKSTINKIEKGINKQIFKTNKCIVIIHHIFYYILGISIRSCTKRNV